MHLVYGHIIDMSELSTLHRHLKWCCRLWANANFSRRVLNTRRVCTGLKTVRKTRPLQRVDLRRLERGVPLRTGEKARQWEERRPHLQKRPVHGGDLANAFFIYAFLVLLFVHNFRGNFLLDMRVCAHVSSS